MKSSSKTLGGGVVVGWGCAPLAEGEMMDITPSTCSSGTSMIRILMTEAISARESIELLALPVSVSLTFDG